MKTTNLIAACLFAIGTAWAAEPGPAADVAPKVENTRIQQWPRAAWNEGAKCWLVAWREGDVTEEKSEIWCARVSADGKALDAGGIRLAGGKKLADRPSVASDGKDFLVVWDDLRNGKDWDVYGARVTGDGKALDADGFLVAGGEHNQCRAAAAFSKGNYLVAYLSFEGQGAPGPAGSGYVIRNMRVSPEGKPLDSAPPALGSIKDYSIWNPTAAAGGDNMLVVSYVKKYGPDYPSNIGLVAGATAASDGKPASPLGFLSAFGTEFCLDPRRVHNPAGAVWTGKGFLVCAPVGAPQKGVGTDHRKQDCVAVWPVDAQGKAAGGPEFAVFGPERLNGGPCVSLAFDGERCLLTEDVILSQKEGRGEALLSQVHGCFLSPEGKPLDGGKTFAISGNTAKTYCSQGFACAGPKGQFLVVYSEARGVDNVKIAAQVVK